jgi:hypothetical protein
MAAGVALSGSEGAKGWEILGIRSEGGIDAFPIGEDAVNSSWSFEKGERSSLPFLLRDEL